MNGLRPDACSEYDEDGVKNTSANPFDTLVTGLVLTAEISVPLLRQLLL